MFSGVKRSTEETRGSDGLRKDGSILQTGVCGKGWVCPSENASVFGDVQGYVRGDNLGHDVVRVGEDYRSSSIPTHPRPAWLRPMIRRQPRNPRTDQKPANNQPPKPQSSLGQFPVLTSRKVGT